MERGYLWLPHKEEAQRDGVQSEDRKISGATAVGHDGTSVKMATEENIGSDRAWVICRWVSRIS